MILARRIDMIRAITEPIQTGYHPMKVKRIVIKKPVKVTVTSGLFPFVAIRTMKILAIVNMREMRIPASVELVSKADAIALSQSDQITMIRKREGLV